MCVRTCVCTCSWGFSEQEMGTQKRGAENKTAGGSRDGDGICFPGRWLAGEAVPLSVAFVLQSGESPCFNACRLTTHCYYTVSMCTSCVI